MTTIKVGDVVTWRSAENPNALGFTGCLVVGLGKTAEGVKAAKLSLGRFGHATARLADLTLEQCEAEAK